MQPVCWREIVTLSPEAFPLMQSVPLPSWQRLQINTSLWFSYSEAPASSPPNIEQLLFIVGGLWGGALDDWVGNVRWGTASPPRHWVRETPGYFWRKTGAKSYLNLLSDPLLSYWRAACMCLEGDSLVPCILQGVCPHVLALKLSPLQKVEQLCSFKRSRDGGGRCVLSNKEE